MQFIFNCVKKYIKGPLRALFELLLYSISMFAAIGISFVLITSIPFTVHSVLVCNPESYNIAGSILNVGLYLCIDALKIMVGFFFLGAGMQYYKVHRLSQS